MVDKNLITLDENSGVPIWMQLRNRLVYLVVSGTVAPGSKLPTVRDLSSFLSVNYNTVSKAYVDLEHSGYVVSVRGRGVFVKEIARESCEDMLSAVDTVLDDAIRRCMAMGMSLDEVRLRMLDVAHAIQLESQAILSEKRNLNERGKGPKA